MSTTTTNNTKTSRHALIASFVILPLFLDSVSSFALQTQPIPSVSTRTVDKLTSIRKPNVVVRRFQDYHDPAGTSSTSLTWPDNGIDAQELITPSFPSQIVIDDIARANIGIEEKLESLMEKSDDVTKPQQEEEVTQVVAEKKEQVSKVPSLRELLLFTFSTTFIWLSQPLLSLVDTTVVGWTSAPQAAAKQIASLGPSTLLYDNLIYLTYFLAIATTNQLAPALAQKDWKQLRQKTSHLLGLSTAFGLGISALIFGAGRQLITQIAGTALSGEIVSLATSYACIRAAVAPFAVVGAVAQSFCLASLDTKTPAMAVIISSIVNIIGDLALSPKFGIQGAAVATAIATVVSTGILLNKVRSTVQQWKVNEEEDEMRARIPTRPNIFSSDSKKSMTTPLVSDKADANNDNAAAAELSSDIPFVSLPDRKSAFDLVKLAGPIFFSIVGKVACYSALTLRATGLGVLPLAAHNIIFQIFCFFACFGDSLSQAAQSYYPSVSKELRTKLLKRLMVVAGCIGAWNFQVMALVVTKFGGLLTKNTMIMELMSSQSLFVGLSLLVHPFIMLFEGTVLASRDLVFLVGAYAATMAMHFGVVFSPMTTSFASVYRALFAFQTFRVTQYAVRVFKKNFKFGRKDRSVPQVQQQGQQVQLVGI